MKKLLLPLILLCLPAVSFAAGTCTVGTPELAILSGSGTTVYSVQVDCTADAADGTYPDTVIENVGGYLLGVYFDPGATVPTTAMDMTVEMGSTGFDLLGGSGADIVTSGNSSMLPLVDAKSVPAPFSGNLTVTLSNNSVNSATLTYYLLISG